MQNRRIIRQSLVGLFFLGAIVFNSPFLNIFNRSILIQGIPLLYFYLFAMWGILIILAGLVVKKHHKVHQE